MHNCHCLEDVLIHYYRFWYDVFRPWPLNNFFIQAVRWQYSESLPYSTLRLRRDR